MHLLVAVTVLLATTAAAAATAESAAEVEITFSPPVRCNATQRTGAPLRGRTQCFPPAQPRLPDPCAAGDEGGSLTLACPLGGVVTKVDFALYGDVQGSCSSGALSKGRCGTDISSSVTAACVGQSGCTVHCSHKDTGCTGGVGPTCGCAITAASGNKTYLKLPDPCPSHAKTQGVTVTCNNTAPAPPTAPTPSCEMAAVVGCFQWPRLDYHAGFYPTFKGNNSHFTQETCADACCAAGYGTDAVSAVSLHPKLPGGAWAWMGADCYCASAKAFDAVFASASSRRNLSECDMKCPGNKSQSCGGAPRPGPNQKLLVSRASCRNCAAALAPPTAPAVAGVRPVVPGAQNVYVHAGICCLWNGKCRAHCHPNCHIHDVPNSVNSTRTVVYRNWSTRVSTAVIADANNYPQAPEGPNENAVALLADNKTVFTVMRLGGGDYGHYYSDYLQSRSTDTGNTWSRPSFIHGAGSVDPKLLRVGQSLVMSGGRNCNNINKTIDGQIRGADLMLWLNADGMATEWVMYSLSYWHNHLGFPGQTNCTERGPDCFSIGLNVSCRTETSAYTALYLDEDGDGNSGWVQYDMHGIQFAMEFTIGPKRR